MTTLELYTKGAKVWIPHPETVWQSGELIEDYQPTQKTLKIRTDDTNEIKTIQIKNEQQLPFLKNPSILIGENDLTSLSYLHEPAVLYNLQVRFCQYRNVYTYCGIVLVAINPYDDLPIYDIDTIQTYRGQAMGDLDPHIFAVAEEAYTKLEREQKDQSIIVSGESGAGKTVSAKYAMRYFATVGGNATETQIEKKVLASSPIMEAIGNAKTTRNDNSSRFGKFIELQFNKQFHISGASMRTYLLEKTRVVFQAHDERNYHIFYQLCAARNDYPHLHLQHQNEFNYLNQGDSPTVDGVDDYQTFQDTLNALQLLEFNRNDQQDMFRILAGILNLGNIQFLPVVNEELQQQQEDECVISPHDKHLQYFSELLEIDLDEIQQWLCQRKIVSMHEIFHKPMSIEDASFSRDALAKHIYAQLFNWIVLVINKALEPDITQQQRYKFIGVLDIYGFETFETNSFEQFCINYANEKLQQQFNLHVFKLEQEEYIKEGIEWKMIDFYDNQPCIDLIETKLGILDLLDEECRMPRGSDGSWTEKLYSKCAKYSHFGKARFGTSAFIIDHFADKVQYESNGFLEKNRDTIIEEQISVLRKSRNQLVKRLFCDDDNQKLMPSGTRVKVSVKPMISQQQQQNRANKKSVGSQFRDSLNLLMQTLNATTPHYVRCIKPNDYKRPFDYNPKRAVQQLRACGVLETIRISAAGFPTRWTYIEFFYRYRVLCKFRDIDRNDIQKTCSNILKQYIKDNDKFQFGKTKIFFRAGQVAYLEKLRGDKLKLCCIMMQKTIRAFLWRKRFLKIKRSVLNIQRYGRGVLARRLAMDLRRRRAAIIIQKHIRGWLKCVQYKKLKKCIEGIQRYSRGYLARLRYMQLKNNAKAIILQRYIRGYLARKRFNQHKRKIIVCQAAIRRFLARRQYKKLKIEARSIEHVKKLNKGLENKIISLQQRIDDLTKTNQELRGRQNEANDLRNKLVTFKALEIEIKNLNQLLSEKDQTINKLQDDIKFEKEEKIDLINDYERFKQEAKQQQDLWSQETLKLRKELDNINEIVKTNQEGAEENLKVRLEEEKMLILNEQESDREAYQKLLQQYHDLEQHCEDLERQINQQSNSTPQHHRNLSDLSSIQTAIDEDNGYSSVPSGSSTVSTLQRDRHESEPATNQVDIGLVLKLQHKLSEIEREKLRMQKRLDELDLSPRTEKLENAQRDSIVINELELVNSKLKTQLYELQQSINEGTGRSKLLEQLQQLQEESERKTEEIIQLKSVLANQTDNMKTLVNNQHQPPAYINEDGELALAYETQKTINKQLELELQDEKNRFKQHEKEYKMEIEKLREDNERQQRILSCNLQQPAQTQNEVYMEHEIKRLTQENLELHDKNDLFIETVRKLKKQNKNLLKKLKENGLDIDDDDLIINTEQRKTTTNNRNLPTIKKKERDYLGMFSYPNGQENTIMKHLVIELKPRTAVALLPCLPAYIVFMCIRYTDHINDDEKVRAVLSAFTNCVKKVVRKRHEDLETDSLWLANTLRLIYNMKQYSGDRAFQARNTPKQNEQSLRNFDLSEYRQVLSDIAVWIYHGLIRNFEEKIQPLIVPAILEHEEIPGISGFRSRTSSLRDVYSPDKLPTHQKPTTLLLQELSNHHKILTFYGVDTDVISQIFKQIFYFICATSLNNLLLRKELCHWSKGLQIRHNLSHVEMWTREKGLDETSIQATLQPIIQAAQLLQARKCDDDVGSVCEMCTALTPLQICKILNLYTPVDEFEQRVPASFIRKVQEKLQERPQSQDQQTLLMDVKYQFPIRFSFKPSDICLEGIEVPDVLNLPMLEKL